MATTQDGTLAELQRTNAVLRQERDSARAERDAARAQRNTEFGERIDHQAATIDVLKAMSASPGDPQPVFDLIARQAAKLCNVPTAAVATFDGTMIHLATQSGFDAAYADAYVSQFPRPVGLDSSMGRAILHRRVDQVEDITTAAGHSFVDVLGHWSVMAVPILRDGVPLGAITSGRPAMGPFSDSQIALLKTFAEQAVIAITSAETYRALQTRTSELTIRDTENRRLIARQEASIEVLRTISASPDDPQPAFELIARRARELCNAAQASVTEYDGALLHMRAREGYDSTTAQLGDPNWRQAPNPETVHGRVVLSGEIVHVRDLGFEGAQEGAHHVMMRRRLGSRSLLGVPLLREGRVVGAIAFGRTEIGGFDAAEVALVESFAEQAAIAITSAANLRALRERTGDLQESLEYQTATSDLLEVIGRSTFDLQPVLDTVVETAVRLCNAEMAVIARREGELFRGLAYFGYPPEYWEWAKSSRAGSPNGDTVGLRAVLEGRVVHVRDVAADPSYPVEAIRLGKQRTSMGVPLLREGEAIGVIVLARQRVEPFTDRQIELVSTFAAQVVIAMENARLLTEQREALEQQTATAEVLQVINASPGNLLPVFDAILEKAHHLCGAAFGELYTFDGEKFTTRAHQGVPSAFAEFRMETPPADAPGSMIRRLREGANVLHIADVKDDELYRIGEPTRVSLVDLGGARTVLTVALRKDESLLGFIVVYRQEVLPFSDRQVGLLQNFAAQAVIAMENARLLTEQQEALEQQTATAEVLQVINASPGNLVPVFDAMLEKAMRLCEAAFGELYGFDGEGFPSLALKNVPAAYAVSRRAGPVEPIPGSFGARFIAGEYVIHIPDLKEEDAYRSGNAVRRAMVDLGGARTAIAVALHVDDQIRGALIVYRQEVRPFSGKQIAVLENFAAQAVIAMENARLLNEIRQHQEELRITFENMGDGVAMFDETQHLVAWNRKFQDILDVPDDIIARRQTFTEYVRYLADRGEYGAGPDVEERVRHLTEQAGQYRTYERTRPDGRVIEIRHNPVPSGGFVLIYADITERRRSEAEISAARDAAEAALRELKAAQANLIQAEKMASLGQLTAGIAHEIKNPLNFVNNFSALSAELIDELREVLIPQPLGDTVRREVDDLTALLKGNLEKVVQHGQRADGIVKAMLEHSRGSSAERRMVDLNVLIDEALNLAYHGARAPDQSFNITLEREFGEGIALIEVNPQDVTRVFLNIFSNGFYAATRLARNGGDAGFVPTLKVTSRDAGEAVEIRVRDNGTGIPPDIRDKLFQPFFTTKPTGEGTGLGLSITYDIVTKQHGGTITVESEVDAFTEFVITLPRQMFTTQGDRA